MKHAGRGRGAAGARAPSSAERIGHVEGLRAFRPSPWTDCVDQECVDGAAVARRTGACGDLTRYSERSSGAAAAPSLARGLWRSESIQQGLWDRFIDALDLAGQEGHLADVPVPALAIDLPPGRLFGELTRDDIESLSKQASKLGRRADVITVMWQDMQRKKKPARKKGLQPRKS